jgi:hypothetical protein
VPIYTGVHDGLGLPTEHVAEITLDALAKEPARSGVRKVEPLYNAERSGHCLLEAHGADLSPSCVAVGSSCVASGSPLVREPMVMGAVSCDVGGDSWGGNVRAFCALTGVAR